MHVLLLVVLMYIILYTDITYVYKLLYIYIKYLCACVFLCTAVFLPGGAGPGTGTGPGPLTPPVPVGGGGRRNAIVENESRVTSHAALARTNVDQTKQQRPTKMRQQPLNKTIR